MTLSRVINLAERHLFHDSSAKGKETLRMLLNEPFDYELSEKDRKRAERKRLAVQTGAFHSQQTLTSAFGMKTKR